MTKDTTKEKSDLADPDIVFSNSEDIKRIPSSLDRYSLEDAYRLTIDKIEAENIKDDSVILEINKDLDDIERIKLSDIDVISDKNRFNINDMIENNKKENSDNKPNVDTKSDIDKEDKILEDEEIEDSEFSHVDLSKQLGKFSKRAYKNTSSSEAFGLYSYLYTILLFIFTYFGIFYPLSYSINNSSSLLSGIPFSEYGVLVGSIAISIGLAIQIFIWWYPRNLNPIEVKTKYNQPLAWFVTIIGSILPVFYIITLLFGYLQNMVIISIPILIISALYADRLMISDETEYFKGLYKESDKRDENITHDHLPNGLYPFNTPRRGFLWSSVTSSLLISHLLFSTSLVYILISLLIYSVPSIFMAYYLIKRRDLDKFVRE